MNSESNEPNRTVPTRHDGWTGEAMAKFLEALADTGVVAEACDAALKSREAAYALRRRDPLFAQAWELALANARDRLADTLLARSIEGNVEQIVKDGEIVAEKHFIDNRLGLAILKRLDQRIDGNGKDRRLSPPSPTRTEPDWDLALAALRTGNEDDIAAALTLLQGNEVDEVDTPSIDGFDDEEVPFRHRRVWRTWQTDEWRTDFPPPPGFAGHEEGDWEEAGYCRALSDEELAALVTAGIAEASDAASVVSIEEDEAARQAFFHGLATRPSSSESVATPA